MHIHVYTWKYAWVARHNHSNSVTTSNVHCQKCQPFYRGPLQWKLKNKATALSKDRRVGRQTNKYVHVHIPDDLCSQNSYSLFQVPLVSFQIMTWKTTQYLTQQSTGKCYGGHSTCVYVPSCRKNMTLECYQTWDGPSPLATRALHG